jgi:heme-degrading monooxygenase HmoA
MVTVGMNYLVIEGKEALFEEKFYGVLDALESASGHEKSVLYKDCKDATNYLIVSEWTAKDAFSEFIRSDSFKAVTNWGKEQILRDRPRHKVYGE